MLSMTLTAAADSERPIRTFEACFESCAKLRFQACRGAAAGHSSYQTSACHGAGRNGAWTAFGPTCSRTDACPASSRSRNATDALPMMAVE